MADSLGLLLLAAFALMGSPGPATISLTAAGSAFGVSRSIGYLIGIIAGTIVVLLMIAAGLGSVVLAVPGVLPVVTALAALYILYLAYKIATAPVQPEAETERKAPSVAGGLLLAATNPKAFAAIGAVYASVALVPESPARDAAAKVVALTVVIVIVNTAWLFIGASVPGLLRRPRIARAVNVSLAILLVLSAGLAALH
jgi:threonine/homoserine/homoserine lactone efflux protein